MNGKVFFKNILLFLVVFVSFFFFYVTDLNLIKIGINGIMLTAHRSRSMAAPASAAPTIFVENIKKTNSRDPSPAGVGITPASICAAAVMHTICQRGTVRSADNTNQEESLRLLKHSPRTAGQLCKIAQKNTSCCPWKML